MRPRRLSRKCWESTKQDSPRTSAPKLTLAISVAKDILKSQDKLMLSFWRTSCKLPLLAYNIRMDIFGASMQAPTNWLTFSWDSSLTCFSSRRISLSRMSMLDFWTLFKATTFACKHTKKNLAFVLFHMGAGHKDTASNFGPICLPPEISCQRKHKKATHCVVALVRNISRMNKKAMLNLQWGKTVEISSYLVNCYLGKDLFLINSSRHRRLKWSESESTHLQWNSEETGFLSENR